ncbi:MAG: AMP-binding protein [Rhodoferax sp.]
MPLRQSSDTPAAFAPPKAYADLWGGFSWRVPARFNIAWACARRWAEHSQYAKNRALIAYSTSAGADFYTFESLWQCSLKLAARLHHMGVQRGDRVAIVLPQRAETAMAYLAVLHLGAVAVPLSQLFGPEALQFRLADSAAVLAVGDAQTLPALLGVRADCPALRAVLGVGALPAGQGAMVLGVDWFDASAQTLADPTPAGADTASDDPAVLIYTSGTTGNPKGALIPHRALIGNLTGFLCSQNGFGFALAQSADPAAALTALCDPSQWPSGSSAVFWSPADWAWTGGLMDALLPSLYYGRSIVACGERFAPELALRLMRDCAVTHSFLFPTALKAIMKAYPGAGAQTVRQQWGLCLQALMSAGEAVGDAVFDYVRDQLGLTLNEMFGQTEVNYIVGNCDALYPPKPGSMGLGYPGHRVAVIDDEGQPCPPGVVGEVAVHRLDGQGAPDPVFFLGYWRNEAATQAKFTSDPRNSWCRTGDLAQADAQGYLWYQGRADDVFKAAGYRIGPGEIENCLLRHPAVANAAVVPKPDAARGAMVKAYVVLAPETGAARAGLTGDRAQFDAELVAQLQAHVKDRLASYEYPKEIEFIDHLPMTTTGKVQRRVLRLQEQARAQQTASQGDGS